MEWSQWNKYIQNMQILNEYISDDLESVSEFESWNSMSISVVGFCRNSKCIVLVRLKKVKMDTHIYILLISSNDLPKRKQKRYTASHHFVAILNISALLATRKKGYNFVCRYCFAMINDELHKQKCFWKWLVLVSVTLDPVLPFQWTLQAVHATKNVFLRFCYSEERTNIEVIGLCLTAFNVRGVAHFPSFLEVNMIYRTRIPVFVCALCERGNKRSLSACKNTNICGWSFLSFLTWQTSWLGFS